MKYLTINQIRKLFKDIYLEEFNDPNESFMDYMLDLIPKNVLINTLENSEYYYYSIIDKYE